MSAMLNRVEDTMSVDEEAAAWFARMTSDHKTDVDRKAFDAWLARDSAHAKAFAAHQDLWSILDDAGSDSFITAEIRRARRGPVRWMPTVVAAAAAMVVIVAGLGTWLWKPPTPEPAVYATEIGARSTITLVDGSVVTLDTDSKITVAYSPARRSIRLLRGRAHFDVAPAPTRPFEVAAAGGTVTATGTSFDVRLTENAAGATVTLMEGGVVVARPHSNGGGGDGVGSVAQAQLNLGPLERVSFSPNHFSAVEKFDPSAAAAWREGRLIFKDTSLADAVAEVNRYSRAKIILGDASLARFHVSGVFRAGKLNNFINAAELSFPLRAVVEDDGDVTLMPSL